MAPVVGLKLKPLEPSVWPNTKPAPPCLPSLLQSMPAWKLSFNRTSTIVASISTCLRALPITLSMNSCTFSCCLLVARTLITPVSALAITFAACSVVYSVLALSRSSFASLASSASELLMTVPFDLPAFPLIRALVFTAWPKRDTITSLSVSANNSLIFFISDSHKWFDDVLSTEVRELLFAPLPEVLLTVPPLPELCDALEIWPSAPIKPLVSRFMFT